MKILTIGGATQDTFLTYTGSDYLTITKKGIASSYLLFESGEKVEIDNIQELTGGGATNSAVSFSRLGFDVSCFSSISQDPAGNKIIEKLKAENVNTSYLHTTTKHRTGTSYIINSNLGERTIFAFRGANGHMQKDKLPIDALTDADYLYITSLSNESSQLLPLIVSQAKKHNVPVAINPGTSQLTKETHSLKTALKDIDILILNSYEAKIFMFALIESDENYKRSLESSPGLRSCEVSITEEKPYLIDNPIPYEDLYFSIRKFFKEALKMGPKIVVITNGCNGVYVATKEKIYFHPSMKLSIVDSVGAGDSFGSCFVASLLLGYPIEQALKNGIINSASVLSYLGAKQGLLSHEQLKSKIDSIDKTLLQVFPL